VFDGSIVERLPCEFCQHQMRALQTREVKDLDWNAR
jgi:hypothetical protein